jgi:glutaminase
MKPNIWAEATINKIKTENPKLAIIADCRFPNEVEAVKKAGGIVIKLMLNPHNSDHDSETALDQTNYNHKNFDLVVYNHNLSVSDKNYAILTFLKKKGLLQL